MLKKQGFIFEEKTPQKEEEAKEIVIDESPEKSVEKVPDEQSVTAETEVDSTEVEGGRTEVPPVLTDIAPTDPVVKNHTRKEELICKSCGKPIGSHTAFVLPDGTYLHLVCSGIAKKWWAKALAFTDRQFRTASLKVADITKVKDWERKVDITTGFRDNEGNENAILRCKIGEDQEECIERLSKEGWNCTSSNAKMDLDGEGNPILKPK
jgi:hypothetical protein